MTTRDPQTSVVQNVVVYDRAGSTIVSNLAGSITEELTAEAFRTQLVLGGPDVSRLVQGEEYYAVGTRRDDTPFQSELVSLESRDGKAATLVGTVEVPAEGSRDGPAATEPTISIEYTNYSKTPFDRSTWGYNLQEGFGGLVTSPGPILRANDGQESIGANQILSAIDQGPADIYLCWAKGINFGVWIHFNFQMFGIGPRPVWYVTTNGSAWTLSGDDPATPYTWSSAALGFDVSGKPTSGHSSLDVSVIIQDLS